MCITVLINDNYYSYFIHTFVYVYDSVITKELVK